MARVADRQPEAEVLEPSPLPITVEQYHQMADLGMFRGKRVQLINGYMIRMPAMKDPHFAALVNLNQRFQQALGGVAVIAQQSPIRVANSQSEPEPDFALVRREDYEGKVFVSSQLFLVVEISDATLKLDQSEKLAIYASEGIPEYWIVNLRDNLLEVYTDPEGSGYLTRHTLKPGQSAAPKTFPNVQIEWW